MPETNPDNSPNPNPFVSLIRNFRIAFPFPFPFPFPADQKSDSQTPTPANSHKPDVVIFADPTPAIPPPLKIESEDSAQSPAVVWQVYALGGYLLARWIWGKWKAKQNDKKDHDENTSPPPNN